MVAEPRPLVAPRSRETTGDGTGKAFLTSEHRRAV